MNSPITSLIGPHMTNYDIKPIKTYVLVVTETFLLSAEIISFDSR